MCLCVVSGECTLAGKVSKNLLLLIVASCAVPTMVRVLRVLGV